MEYKIDLYRNLYLAPTTDPTFTFSKNLVKFLDDYFWAVKYRQNEKKFYEKQAKGDISVVEIPSPYDRSPTNPYALPCYNYLIYCKNLECIKYAESKFDYGEYSVIPLTDFNYSYLLSVKYHRGQ